MGNPPPDSEHILVPIKELQKLGDELDELITMLDGLVRLRTDLVRLQRLFRELDPDKTPIKSMKPPDDAYRTSSVFTPALDTPRWGPKK